MTNRKAKIFISCGQRPNEINVAEKVKNLLEEKGFDHYLSIKIMSLDDIMKITEELNSSDYYLFLDFYRDLDNKNKLPISLFTHQELSWAKQAGFKDNIIILKDDKTPLEGFLKYIQGNPETFSDENELLLKLDKLIEDMKWSPGFSRHLSVTDLEFKQIKYRDHTGEYDQWVCEIKIHNKRPDIVCFETICILDYIEENSSKRIESPDRSYLKWAGQASYDRHIPPKDFANIAVFYLDANKRGIFLNSLADITPRNPIIKNDGTYILSYKLFSINVPPHEFKIKLNFIWDAPNRGRWNLRTKAELLK